MSDSSAFSASRPPEHCRSYYAATRNDQTRYAALDGDIEIDICIIGGGFSGISTALTLAERGEKVALIEANLMGWGASGRNGGQVIGGIERQERLAKVWGERAQDIFRALRFHGHDIIKGRLDRYQIDCDFAHGSIIAATKQSHMKGLEADFRGDGDSAHMELVDREGVRALLGTDNYHGGLVDRRDAHLHPLNLCLGEARAAASLGVRMFEQTPAIDILPGDGFTITTPNGRIHAKSVVLAGNAYHRLERRKLGGLLFPAGSYIIATEPLGEARAARFNPRNLAVIDSNLVIDYFRLSADKRMLFGGLCHYSNRDPANITAALRPRMLQLYPDLEDVKVDFEWGGKIGIVITRVPLIRRIAPDFYALQGYSGHGIAMTHIAGEIVADAICGDAGRLELFSTLR